MAENKDLTVEKQKKEQEAQLTSVMESELSDEQLFQLAEGSSSWGANCNATCHCN